MPWSTLISCLLLKTEDVCNHFYLLLSTYLVEYYSYVVHNNNAQQLLCVMCTTTTKILHFKFCEQSSQRLDEKDFYFLKIDEYHVRSFAFYSTSCTYSTAKIYAEMATRYTLTCNFLSSNPSFFPKQTPCFMFSFLSTNHTHHN